MTESPKYKYRPIQGSDGLRLIELEPNSDLEAIVECSLSHTTLREYDEDLINHYTALSYAWGDAKNTKTIRVEGLAFDITLNLDSALRYVRDSMRKCFIWADALCINQLDDEEKSFQVKQMGDVYRNATHTIIFLGEATESTEHILNTCINGEWFTPTEAYSSLSWEDILDRPWFQRVWVYQELVFSRDPWVQCGRTRLRWDMLHRSIMNIRQADRQIHPWRNFLLMKEGRKKFKEINGERKTDYVDDFLEMLDARRGFGVTDPRDMLFTHRGILGHPPTHPWSPELVDVDYSKDSIEVYQSIVKYTLARTRDYRILSHAEANYSLDKSKVNASYFFPTWVPDWSHQKFSYRYCRLRNVANFIMTQMTEAGLGNRNLYQGVSIISGYRSAFPKYISNRILMAVSGFQVGTICLISDQTTDRETSLKLTFGSMEGLWIGGTRRTVVSVIFDHWRHILDPIMADRSKNDSLPGGGRQLNFRQELQECITESDLEFLRGIERPVSDLPYVDKAEHLIRHLVLHAITSDSEGYPRFLYGRRFGTLHNGRLVLVPAGAKVGDTVCFFEGDLTLPFLLRLYARKLGFSDEDEEARIAPPFRYEGPISHFELVGECIPDELILRSRRILSSMLESELSREIFVLH
ncbi:hypothetical protein VTL71DRAFT_6746 [Oculimacula yallundae]|uniref:Heterokaryon incompatibility domain-containing protein n=1 Tax=Oculimacula yallundae TaxID=86028 RepID=A0ABR4BXZ2_9HELO